MSSTFRTQKNGVKNVTVTQWRTGKHLCPVRIWADIITRLDSYPGTLYDTPVNTVWVENHKTTITSQMTMKSLRSVMLSFGEERLSRILTQRSGHPLTPVSIFHGDLPSQSKPRNYHNNWAMVLKLFPPVHPDSGQRPQKMYQ